MTYFNDKIFMVFKLYKIKEYIKQSDCKTHLNKKLISQKLYVEIKVIILLLIRF